MSLRKLKMKCLNKKNKEFKTKLSLLKLMTNFKRTKQSIKTQNSRLSERKWTKKQMKSLLTTYNKKMRQFSKKTNKIRCLRKN